MYGEHVYAVGVFSLYGCLAVVVVPLLKKALYVRRIVNGEFVYHVEERTQEGALSFYLVKSVDALKMFSNVKERQRLESSVGFENGSRHLLSCDAVNDTFPTVAFFRLFHTCRLRLYIHLVEHSDVCLHNLVCRMEDEAQRPYNGVHSNGAVQSVGFA